MADEQGISGAFRHVLDAISDGVYVTGPDRTIVYWSAGADAALAQQFAMFKRLGRRYGVIQVDIDEVKAVNDLLGHLTGDGAIRFVADVLSGSVREMDVAARFGGDEFVVICALASEVDLVAHGRRLVRIVHDSRFAPAEEAGLRVTVSAGGALVAADDPVERAALARADAAMYAAKRQGRDDFAVAGNGSGR